MPPDSWLVLTREQIVEMLRVFLPEDAAFEVRRIVKAFTGVQWLGKFDRRFGEYGQAPCRPGSRCPTFGKLWFPLRECNFTYPS